MKKIYTVLGLLLMGASFLSAYAQAPTDAYRNIKTGTQGSARSQALGGAMGAVGADASASYINPAGAGLFQRNTLSLGFDLGKWNTTTEGMGGKTDADKFLGNFNHVSYFFPGSLIKLSGLNYIKINGGISYEKEYNYNRSYGLLSGPMPGGITDLMVFRAINRGVPAGDYLRDKEYDPFINPVDPIVAMGMNGAFIIEVPYNDLKSTEFKSNLFVKDGNNNIQYLLPISSDLNVTEKGGRNSTDLTMAVNLNDMYFFGASLRFGTSTYSRYSMYREDFETDSYLEYGNMLSTNGTSFGLNLGAMVALGDYARLGISYLTPQYAKYDESYRATTRLLNMDLPEDKRQIDFDTEDYRSSYGMLMPGKLTVSAMAFLGRYGFISYDYQYRNLGSSKLLLPDSFDETFESQFIKEDYGSESTHRVGLEVRPLGWMTIRGGYSFTSNPMKVADLKQDPIKEDLYYNVPSSGMIADFTLPRSFSTYSVGLGFNLTRDLAIDMAYVHSKREQAVYPFSGYSFTAQDGNPYELSVRGGKLSEVRNSFVTSLVFRF
ncbi:hypothetical protein QYZ87_08720 [Porphyromonadaceae bacterium W3.11]|nr:hypothetical protein [Porphyromonadaceae bacterium W3.11]